MPETAHDETAAFWHTLDELIATSEIVLDRPCGTTHPRYPGMVYPLDYGYLKETRANDGAGIDVWIGTLPERHLTGIVCTADLRKRDAEIKCLLGCTEAESEMIASFHRAGGMAAMYLPRP